jgi:hypothetical protein
MSPADLRTSRRAARQYTWAAAATTFAVTLSLLTLFLLVAPGAGRAAAASSTAALTVSMDRSLSLVSDSAALTVTGDTISAVSPDATVEASVTGPATLAQITETNPSLAMVGEFTVTVGSLSSTGRPNASQLHLPIPPTSLPYTSGAYRVTVSIRTGGTLVAAGSTWMGRVLPRTAPLDVAFVWRAELGIHRDTAGRFFDTTLDDACAPAAAGGASTGADGSLAALAGLHTQFPDWQFSLGLEPVLLTQLRDMADGFTRADGSANGAAVSVSDPAAKNAKAVLSSLADAAGSYAVEVAAGSYADADLGLLSTQKWRDGFEQIQLGKEEITATLGLGLPPAGAFSPGLDVTSGAVGDYGQASVDHVLVDAGVVSDFNEPVAKGTVAARVHDDANDRVTLVLADSDLRKLMAPPWDASALFAGIAAVLASGGRDALVLTPDPEFALPPGAYLAAIGTELGKDSWIRTQTMAGLLRVHPPGTRPVLLTREAALPAGYIGQTIFDAIKSAHTSVDELAVGADAASAALESARRSLYIAESSWWSRKGVSPDQASAGLAYATQAQALSSGVLSKIRLTGVKASLIWGRNGQVTLTATNDSQSAITVAVHLSGKGLKFPKGEVVTVKLGPGANEIQVPVIGGSSTERLTAGLVVGATKLDEESASLRFITVTGMLPWAGLAVLVIVLAVLVILLVRKRKTPKTPAERKAGQA